MNDNVADAMFELRLNEDENPRGAAGGVCNLQTAWNKYTEDTEGSARDGRAQRGSFGGRCGRV